MAWSKAAILFSVLFLLGGAVTGISSGSARADEICRDMPGDALSRLPDPLRKWGQIACTAHGQTLGSRDGWIWASLKDASNVSIAAGSPQDRANFDDGLYFTDVAVAELTEDEFAPALAEFRHGMALPGLHPKGYMVELTVTSGAVARVVFFDFGGFAGGMWCPAEECVPNSQFLIMKQDEKGQTIASLAPARLRG